jgi:hypothetical protein
MPTLFLHTPHYQVSLNQKRDAIKTKHAGPDRFAIPKATYEQIVRIKNLTVVVLSKDEEIAFEGVLKCIRHSGETRAGMLRYDINFMKQPRPIKDEARLKKVLRTRLTRTGIAFRK